MPGALPRAETGRSQGSVAGSVTMGSCLVGVPVSQLRSLTSPQPITAMSALCGLLAGRKGWTSPAASRVPEAQLLCLEAGLLGPPEGSAPELIPSFSALGSGVTLGLGPGLEQPAEALLPAQAVHAGAGAAAKGVKGQAWGSQLRPCSPSGCTWARQLGRGWGQARGDAEALLPCRLRALAAVHPGASSSPWTSPCSACGSMHIFTISKALGPRSSL